MLSRRKPREPCYRRLGPAQNLRQIHFSHIAVVTDHGLLNALVNMFKPFFHGEVRLFKLAELPAAKDWITKAPEGA